MNAPRAACGFSTALSQAAKGAKNMGFLGRWDVIIPLLIIALLVFGARRLPEIGSAAGNTIRSFQKAMREGEKGEEQPALPPASDDPATPRS
jgi:sec-independent protein translocase protein TatA